MPQCSGILPIMINGSNVYMVLGREQGSEKLCGFSGQMEPGETEEVAAAREFTEESLSILPLLGRDNHTFKTYRQDVQTDLEQGKYLLRCEIDVGEFSTTTLFVKEFAFAPESPELFRIISDDLVHCSSTITADILKENNNIHALREKSSIILIHMLKLLEIARYTESDQSQEFDAIMYEDALTGVNIYQSDANYSKRRVTWMIRHLPSKTLVFRPQGNHVPEYIFRKSFFMALHPILVHVNAAFTCTTPLRMPRSLHPSILVRDRAMKRKSSKKRCSRLLGDLSLQTPKIASSEAL
jgi:hypothetical protein